MDNIEEDENLELVKASAALLSDLERDLPKVLWKKPSKDSNLRRVHHHVKKHYLDDLTNLIEPFQGEPQLLDAKLKALLPPLVDAYLAYLNVNINRDVKPDHVSLETAVCCLLYTFCKVRGYKVITGFLNNEPRYLEPVLEALERTALKPVEQKTLWQVPYVLLLWLSQLLLTPFDLSSISAKPGPSFPGIADDVGTNIPPLTARILRIGLHYLPSSIKAQDAAAAMVVRLIKRPDVLPLRLADLLVQERLPKLEEKTSQMQDMYEMLGSLRLIAGMASFTELSYLIPSIYRSCEKAFDDQDNSAVASNAVAKKIVVKIFRNTAILSLQSVASKGLLLSFLETSSVLETVIDYLLRSLADKDTPVRYAAAKGISLIVLKLESEMGHEVVQALLDSFKEDLPRSSSVVDFITADPLKWHGLTLALAHCLFKQSASPAQLPDILNALIGALQFQQRTATGSTLGTNVRDAANFGIWALARRYKTADLYSVELSELHFSGKSTQNVSIIQLMAIQLMLAACFDPAGNIRRGSSAALQELVGRHSDQVHEGISLVQIVDYQSVGLRNRAMLDVANKAALLHPTYWRVLLEALFGWRGLGSADVPSREAAAASIAGLATSQSESDWAIVLRQITFRVGTCSTQDVERLHGLCLAASHVLPSVSNRNQQSMVGEISSLFDAFPSLQIALSEFSPRTLRSEYPAALAKLATALINATLAGSLDNAPSASDDGFIPVKDIDLVIDRLMARHEDWILSTIPNLVRSSLQLKRRLSASLTTVDGQTLMKKVAKDASKSTLQGAGRAIALGSLVARYNSSAGLTGENAMASIKCLSSLMDAMNVDWRIVGTKALQLVADELESIGASIEIHALIYNAILRGLQDYTIDERGDVGSLVRLQAITCADKLLANKRVSGNEQLMSLLKSEIHRLSLEKLDRVRSAAAQCGMKHLVFNIQGTRDINSISSIQYFMTASIPLVENTGDIYLRAVLQGYISCAGTGAESLLQASRQALVSILDNLPVSRLQVILTAFASIMKDLLSETQNTQPALDLLAFLLDMQIPQRLATEHSEFRWRSLLSMVQKSHHKSNDIPKILAAVHVYVGMADVQTVRAECVKKLINMLRTNPYPIVRASVGEALWMVTEDESLKTRDWAKPPAQHVKVIEQVQQRHMQTQLNNRATNNSESDSASSRGSDRVQSHRRHNEHHLPDPQFARLQTKSFTEPCRAAECLSASFHIRDPRLKAASLGASRQADTTLDPTLLEQSRHHLLIQSTGYRMGSTFNSSAIIPSARDLLLVLPRLAQRAGTFAFNMPEAMDNIAGKIFNGGSVIADATAQQTTVNSTITNMSVAAAAQSTAAAWGATFTETWANRADESSSTSLFMNLAQGVAKLKNFGGIFSYLTSRWALTTFTVAIILNRTQFYASSREHLRLRFHMRLAMYLIPIAAFLTQTMTILQAMKCQTSPDFPQLRYGDPLKHLAIDFASEGGFLYKLSSTLLFWQDDYSCCQARNMSLVDLEDDKSALRGSLSLLYWFFLALCTSQFFETLTCALQGKQPMPETGMTIFEHSLAFAECEAMISSALGFGFFGVKADTSGAGENASPIIHRSEVLQRLNVPPEVLLVCLISCFSHLSSSLLAVAGIRHRLRLPNTTIWAICYMSAFVWSLAKIFTSLGDSGAELGVLRFPTVCIVGFIPHLLILHGIVVCAIIYGLAILITALSIPSDAAAGLSFRQRLSWAYNNLQANVQFSQSSSIRIKMSEDFYTTLLKLGFNILTAASEAVYLNEGCKIQVAQMTWLEKKRIDELACTMDRRKGPPVPPELLGDGIARGVGFVDTQNEALGQSPYACERKSRPNKSQYEKQNDPSMESGLGLVQRRSRTQLTGDFIYGIFWLIINLQARLLLYLFTKLGIEQRPSWLLKAAGISEGGSRRPSAYNRPGKSDLMDFYLVGADGAPTVPLNDEFDVEEETRRRKQRAGSYQGEQNIADEVYRWWTQGGKFGDVDNSGDFETQSEIDDDFTSVMSMSTTNDEEEDNGRRTPTSRDPYSIRSGENMYSRESTPVPDAGLDLSSLSRLLNPQSAADREEARMLSYSLQSNRTMTRSRYRRSMERGRAEILGGLRSANRPQPDSPSPQNEEEEERDLEQFILGQRSKARAQRSGTWESGAEGMGEGGPQCVVCQSQPRTILVWPCGCLSMCDECRVGLAARNYTKCICCRTDIAAYSRLYVP